MRNFRLLRPDEIECRVARVTEKSVQLLLYKTARTDAALLDDTVGSMYWCNDYKTIDGKMYCGIGIKDKDTCQWVWKWNCGTESNMEAEKGEASDAFKRAGFVWGIGAELYSSPQIYVPIAKTTAKNGKCFDVFEVTSIGYDNAENINALVISLNGEPVWNMGIVKKTAKKAEPKKQEEDLPFVFHDEPGDKPEVFSDKKKPIPKDQDPILKDEPLVLLTGDKRYTCSKCGAEISEKVAKYSKEKMGKYLCYKCQKA